MFCCAFLPPRACSIHGSSLPPLHAGCSGILHVRASCAGALACKGLPGGSCNSGTNVPTAAQDVLLPLHGDSGSVRSSSSRRRRPRPHKVSNPCPFNRIKHVKCSVGARAHVQESSAGLCTWLAADAQHTRAPTGGARGNAYAHQGG